MKKKENISDIYGLSEAFIETLKEISKSGNVLNSTTISQFLAKKKIIKDLLKQANRSQEVNLKTTRKDKLEILQSEIEDYKEKEKETRKKIVNLDLALDKEKDLNKRATFILLNLCRIPGKESFFEILDGYKQLVIDEAELDKRNNVLNEINNQIIKAAINQKEETDNEDESIIEARKSKRSVLKKFFGGSSETKLKPLKNSCIKALEELQIILGDNFHENIKLIKDRVNKYENIDYLLSLRKQIIELIQNYVQSVQTEKTEITGFIKVIGNKLIEMEKEIFLASAYSNKSLEEDYEFNKKLEDQIKEIGESVNESKDFKSLKSLIISELSLITDTLDKKQKKYAERIEKSKNEKAKLQQYFGKMINNVMEQNRALIEQNQKDSLTGIYNRPTFEELLNLELQRYQRYNDTFSLVMFDIDYFKNVNDVYGHEAGDRVLRGIAKSIGNTLRKTDVFARYGGEEFVILLPKTDITKGYKVSEKLRLTIQDTEFLYESVKVPITVSVGITEVNSSDKEFNTIFNRVDSYMYTAKKEGRNKVISDREINVSEHSPKPNLL